MSDSYSAARSKLRQAEETSALETDVDDDEYGQSRRRKRPQHLSSSDSELAPSTIVQNVQKKAKKTLLALPPVPSAPIIG